MLLILHIVCFSFTPCSHIPHCPASNTIHQCRRCEVLVPTGKHTGFFLQRKALITCFPRRQLETAMLNNSMTLSCVTKTTSGHSFRPLLWACFSQSIYRFLKEDSCTLQKSGIALPDLYWLCSSRRCMCALLCSQVCVNCHQEFSPRCAVL